MQWKWSFAASDHVVSSAFAGEDEKWKLNTKTEDFACQRILS